MISNALNHLPPGFAPTMPSRLISLRMMTLRGHLTMQLAHGNCVISNRTQFLGLGRADDRFLSSATPAPQQCKLRDFQTDPICC